MFSSAALVLFCIPLIVCFSGLLVLISPLLVYLIALIIVVAIIFMVILGVIKILNYYLPTYVASGNPTLNKANVVSSAP